MKNGWWLARGNRDNRNQNFTGQELASDRMEPRSTAGLSRIIPFLQAIRGLLISILIWGWKVAPVVLYEACIPIGDATDAITSLNGRQAATKYVVKTRLQKALIVPWALGFYLFLYERVSLPFVFAMNCCSNYTITVLVSLALIVIHFASGLMMHFRQERQHIELEVQQREVEVQQREVELQRCQGQVEATTDYQLENKMPSHQGRSNNNADVEYRESTPKKRFWPFGNGKKLHRPTGGSLATSSSSSALV